MQLKIGHFKQGFYQVFRVSEAGFRQQQLNANLSLTALLFFFIKHP